MPSTAVRPKPVLKQSSLQFGTRKSGKAAAEGKGKQSAGSAVETPASAAQILHPPTPDVQVISDDSDIEEFTAPDQEMSEVELVEEDEEAEAAPVRVSRVGKGRAATLKKKNEDEVDGDEIEEVEEVEEVEKEQPPKKKRRMASRSARASIEILADDDPSTSAKKGKQAKIARGRKGVFRSRDGTENAEPVKEESWVVESKKIKITAQDSKVAKHVDVAAMRKHFGFVREKMGNVKPIHAANQSMEDHILRFFDLSYEFGPCIGVNRLQRWERAEALGLEPPQVVKQLLTNEDGRERAEVKECVFFGEV